MLRFVSRAGPMHDPRGGTSAMFLAYQYMQQESHPLSVIQAATNADCPTQYQTTIKV